MDIRRRLDLTIRFEIAAFLLAAAIHGGLFVDGYEHEGARIAELIIGIALMLGLVVAGTRPRWATGAVLAAQAFALLGTIAGVIVVITGVGPRTVPDIVYHIVMLAVAAWGLVLARRWRAATTGSRAEP